MSAWESPICGSRLTLARRRGGRRRGCERALNVNSLMTLEVVSIHDRLRHDAGVVVGVVGLVDALVAPADRAHGDGRAGAANGARRLEADVALARAELAGADFQRRLLVLRRDGGTGDGGVVGPGAAVGRLLALQGRRQRR